MNQLRRRIDCEGGASPVRYVPPSPSTHGSRLMRGVHVGWMLLLHSHTLLLLKSCCSIGAQAQSVPNHISQPCSPPSLYSSSYSCGLCIPDSHSLKLYLFIPPRCMIATRLVSSPSHYYALLIKGFPRCQTTRHIVRVLV